MPRPALFVLALLAGIAPVAAQPASEGSGNSGTGIETPGGAGSGCETSAAPGAGASVPTAPGPASAPPARQIAPETGGPVLTAPTSRIPDQADTASTCSDAVSGNLLLAGEIVPIDAEHPLAIVPVCASVALDEASMSELRPFIASNARLSEALTSAGYGPEDVVAISRDTDAIILYVPQG